jgi:2-succinyl-6-hydroxy-2,4-cyclohexadiene-1-carboxylate synthase
MGDPSDWDLVRRELSDYEIVTPLIQPAEDWNAGIEQLVDELPERSVLIGYSMGARLSLAIALARSKICDGLVFVSGNPGLEEEHAREVRYQSDTKIADRIEAQPRRDFLASWYAQSTVFRSLTDQVREDEIERKAARTGDNWSEILRVYSVAKQPDFWPQLSRLQIPVMAMAGILDRKYTNIILRMGAEPNIESRVVPSCGHIVHREQPYVFLQLIREYLECNFPKE